MSDLMLEVGEWYLRRDGGIVGPVTQDGGFTNYPLRIGDLTYTVGGRTWNHEERPTDLVEHIPITDRRHPQFRECDVSGAEIRDCSSLEETEYVEVLMRMPKPPEGWQYTGEFRVPEECEEFVDKDGLVTTMVDTSGMYPCPIVVKDWQPPSWMPKGWWYCIDTDGHETLTNREPFFEDGDWELASCARYREIQDCRFDRPTARGRNAIWEVK